MKKERTNLPLSSIKANAGQLSWLPKNPRQWTQTDIDRTRDSILEDPDFLEDRPLLVVPDDKGGWIVFAGNLRREGARAAKLKEVPCIVYYPETDSDHATIKRRAIKDNGSFGSWDTDALANEWDDLPLADWGIPEWLADIQEEEVPVNLDAAKKEKDFILKITFPDADKMTSFVMAYKDILEKDYGCLMSESGGAL